MRLAIALVLVAACEREERELRPPEHVLTAPAMVSTYAGEARPLPGIPLDPAMPDYEETAYDVAEGKLLFRAFNCVGCHAAGGGAIGPALIDREWAYGSRPHDVATSIIAGRPRGMPSFRGKLTRQQLYQLVAFVRTLGGLVRGDASAGRDDHMHKVPVPNLDDHGVPTLPKEEP